MVELRPGVVVTMGVGLAPLGAFGFGTRLPNNGDISRGEGVFTTVFNLALRTISNSGPRYRGTLDSEKLSIVRPGVRFDWISLRVRSFLPAGVM